MTNSFKTALTVLYHGLLPVQLQTTVSPPSNCYVRLYALYTLPIHAYSTVVEGY